MIAEALALFWGEGWDFGVQKFGFAAGEGFEKEKS